MQVRIPLRDGSSTSSPEAPTSTSSSGFQWSGTLPALDMQEIHVKTIMHSCIA